MLRSRTALGAAGSAARAARSDAPPAPRRMSLAAREAAAGKAAKDPTRLSEAGLAALRAELEELTTLTRPAIVARIVAARELGDLKENSDYHEARREQSFAEGRIRAIEDLLRNVVLIEEGVEGGRSRLGSTVVVESSFGGRRSTPWSARPRPARPRADLDELADRRGPARPGGRRRGRGRRTVGPAALPDRRGSLRITEPRPEGRGPVRRRGGARDYAVGSGWRPARRSIHRTCARERLGSSCSSARRRRRGSSSCCRRVTSMRRSMWFTL